MSNSGALDWTPSIVRLAIVADDLPEEDKDDFMAITYQNFMRDAQDAGIPEDRVTLFADQAINLVATTIKLIQEGKGPR